MDSPSRSLRDRIWVAVCLLSLVCYLLFSQAIPEFVREVTRLTGRL